MITPENITTVSVSQLPIEPFNLSDPLPHEVNGLLKQGTVQSLADVIGAYLETSGGVGFRAVTVNDGETLPATTQEEFILVGAGTFYNVGGGATITTTEELNALVSNGIYWFIGVEIPINVELAGITQLIRSGFTNTTPSEDAVFNALADKVSMVDLNNFTITDQVVTILGTQNFTLPVGHKPIAVYLNGSLQYKTTSNNASLTNRWSQTGDIITLTKTTAVNNYVYIISQ